MSYAVKQDMIDRFGLDEMIQLTDRTSPPAGVINDVVLNAAMADVDDEINSYLQAKYQLPLTSVPLLIQKLAREMTRFYLYDDNPTDPVAARYEAAIKTLQHIAKGIMHLGLDAADQPQTETAMPETRADASVFTPDALSGFTG